MGYTIDIIGCTTHSLGLASIVLVAQATVQGAQPSANWNTASKEDKVIGKQSPCKTITMEDDLNKIFSQLRMTLGNKQNILCNYHRSIKLS